MHIIMHNTVTRRGYTISTGSGVIERRASYLDGSMVPGPLKLSGKPLKVKDSAMTMKVDSLKRTAEGKGYVVTRTCPEFSLDACRPDHLWVKAVPNLLTRFHDLLEGHTTKEVRFTAESVPGDITMKAVAHQIAVRCGDMFLCGVMQSDHYFGGHLDEPMGRAALLILRAGMAFKIDFPGMTPGSTWGGSDPVIGMQVSGNPYIDLKGAVAKAADAHVAGVLSRFRSSSDIPSSQPVFWQSFWTGGLRGIVKEAVYL